MEIDLSQTTETASTLLNTSPPSTEHIPEENIPGSATSASAPKDKYDGFFSYSPHPDENDPDYRFALRGNSLNPIIDATTPLFGMVIRIRTLTLYEDVASLWRQVSNEIEAIEQELKQQGYGHEVLLPFRYMLCTYIWNERDDSILIQNYIQGNLDLYVYTIEYQYISEHEAMNFSAKVMIKLIDSINPHIVQLETNDYSLHQSKVFPDRLPVGWMFYIDKSYDEKTINLPKQMHSIKREGQPVGTLFVTKRDFFDGSNKADITLSNDLEIALVAHDILPTYKKIF